jgi:hypothetical protein
MVTREGSRPASAEQRLKELGVKLPTPPEPFGAYAEAVQTGNLLFLSGMLPTEGHGAKFVGRVGAELDVVWIASGLPPPRKLPGTTRFPRVPLASTSSGNDRPVPLEVCKYSTYGHSVRRPVRLIGGG